MREIIRAMDNLPRAVKILLALPVIDTVWFAYRLFSSVEARNKSHAALAAALTIFGLPILWLGDFISIAARGEVIWFAGSNSETDSN